MAEKLNEVIPIVKENLSNSIPLITKEMDTQLLNSCLIESSISTEEEEEEEGLFRCTHNNKNYGPVHATSSLAAANKMFTLISRDAKKNPRP